MRTITLAISLCMLLCATTSWAVPFWYNDEQVAATVEKYFQTVDVTADMFAGLDLSILEDRNEAKYLGAVLGDLLKPIHVTLDGQADAIDIQEEETDRFFLTLYTKELHDEFWHQVRPSKQAAYKKALSQLRAMKDEHNVLAVKVVRLDAVRKALRAIARRFKEITL